MSKKPQIALWGAGNIGQRHAEQIKRIGTLVAVVDPNQSAALKAVDGDAARCYATTEAFWQDHPAVDIVVVATPNHLHATQSIDALEHGAHVLCEKPMAISSVDARCMAQVAQRCNRHLLVVKQNRYNPPVVWTRALLDAGKLGQLTNIHLSCFWHRPASYYHNAWRGRKLLDGGTLYTQFSHFVDLLLWFAGPLTLDDAYTTNLQHQGIMETEDTGVIRWRTREGGVVSMHYSVNCYSRNGEGSMLILGTEGSVRIGGQYLNQLSWVDVPGVVNPSIGSAEAANDYGVYQGSMRNHHLVYNNLLDVWMGKAQPDVQLSEAIQCVEVIERVYQFEN